MLIYVNVFGEGGDVKKMEQKVCPMKTSLKQHDGGRVFEFDSWPFLVSKFKIRKAKCSCPNCPALTFKRVSSFLFPYGNWIMDSAGFFFLNMRCCYAYVAF